VGKKPKELPQKKNPTKHPTPTTKKKTTQTQFLPVLAQKLTKTLKISKDSRDKHSHTPKAFLLL